MKIDLIPFCDTYNTRYAINTPRIIDGQAYATDCRVLIRCDPSHANDFTGEDGKFPKVQSFMEKIAQVKKWGLVEVESCNHCNSKGTITSQCDVCDSLGNYTCPTCEHEQECFECDGNGNVTKDCQCRERTIGKVMLAAKYLYLVDHLPGVEWQLDAKQADPVFFRFAHGDGALMGISTE